jgi:putative ABC transport system substrate-binding protein
MMLHRLILSLLLLLAMPMARADMAIHLILSENGPAYQEVAETFRKGIGARASVKTWALTELAPSQLKSLSRSAVLLVPIGVKAARLVAENYSGFAHVLCLMVPRAVSGNLEWSSVPGQNKSAAVFIDQPLARTLSLIEATFPQARRVGLMISPENSVITKALGQESMRRKLSFNVEPVATPLEVAPALRRLLPDSDVLLLVPDAMAINAGNAQNVLLTTYRYRVPVVGFSQGLAKAGAVASVYSSPTQIGRQGTQMALRLIETGELPHAQHASEFSIAFNPHVARSLGMSAPNEAEIRQKLGAQDD